MRGGKGGGSAHAEKHQLELLASLYGLPCAEESEGKKERGGDERKGDVFYRKVREQGLPRQGEVLGETILRG